MSTTAVGGVTPPYVFADQGSFDAPHVFPVPGTLAIRPDTAHATFDGTGASGDFLACLTFYDASGNRLARMFNPAPVVMGDTAAVTFVPPFGSAASSTSPSGGSGLQFTANGVYGPANTGDALDVATTTTNTHGDGQTFDAGSQDVVLKGGKNTAGRQSQVLVGANLSLIGGTGAPADTTTAQWTLGAFGDTDISGFAHDYVLQLGGGNTGHNSGDYRIRDHSGGLIFLARDAGGVNELGVFGVGPVPQQATPVTLADVIAILRAYGFAA